MTQDTIISFITSNYCKEFYDCEFGYVSLHFEDVRVDSSGGSGFVVFSSDRGFVYNYLKQKNSLLKSVDTNVEQKCSVQLRQ